MLNAPRVFVALDYDSAAEALAFVDKVTPESCGLKVGKELFTLAGPALIHKLVEKDFKVFLDLKFHDIPVTVARAVKAASSLGVFMVNVHASGSAEMLKAAAEALAPLERRPLLIAVTVLTSMNREQLSLIGLDVEPQTQVLRLARLTKECGLDGVVCSAQEASLLTREIGPDFLKVTPGIRPQDAALGDQKRVMTPAMAIASGADYLVVGRPITRAADPLAVLKSINAEISSVQA